MAPGEMITSSISISSFTSCVGDPLKSFSYSCSANVGYGNGITYQNLGPGCGVGNIQHEFLHNLGFFHEHSRSDRDNWVTIHLENVNQRFRSAFRKYSTSNSQNFSPYDYGSIMHYPSHAFSSNGKATIVAKQSLRGKVMGQRSALSAADLQKVRRAYRCK